MNDLMTDHVKTKVTTWLMDIPIEQCRDLLAASPLGRLAVVHQGRPQIFPVNHVYDAETDAVMFPTKEGTKLNAALDWPFVAFEVDGVHPSGDGGWSVLVIGHAEQVDDPAVIARAVRARQVLWAEGANARWVRIVPTQVTGRRITAVSR